MTSAYQLLEDLGKYLQSTVAAATLFMGNANPCSMGAFQ
jgi:hypothetical protein